MSIASPFTATDLAVAIRASVMGDVVTPDEPSFAAATFGFGAGGADPELVVIAARAADVAATIRAAARAGRRVRVQTPAGTTGDGTVLIVTRLLASVHIEPWSRTATVGVAAGWRQVLDAAEPHGLFAPGSGTTAGAPAPTAAGFGFSAEHIAAVEIVTTTGELAWVDRRSDPQLFERLRRGRGVGVVTAMVVDLVPLPSLYAGALWLAADANPVALQRYHEWAASLPANTSTSISRHPLPDDDQVPASLRGREGLRVGFAHLGNPADGAQLIAPLRAAAPWLLDSVTETPWSAVGVGPRTPGTVRQPVAVG